MKIEDIRGGIEDFTSRPFDEAASNLAYLLTLAVPLVTTINTIVILSEDRTLSQSLGSVAANVCIYLISGKLRSRVVQEGKNHRSVNN